MTKHIYIAGHAGMVGSALLRRLESQRDGQDQAHKLITKSRQQLDLCNQAEVEHFFNNTQIDQVYLAAAKVGGIHANNTYPADFAYQNLMIQTNVINSAFQAGVKKLLFLGSSCIYPRLATQPMSEQALLSDSLEPTNEAYAIAKIAGIKLCESYNRQHGVDYRSVMPTNLYGAGDNFHPHNSHVIPALMQRFHRAKQEQLAEVEIWGSGKPKREFLHVDDMADACCHVMNLSQTQYQAQLNDRSSHINVGSGVECTIAELAQTIKKVVAYSGDITFNTSKPDGAPRKRLDVSRLSSLGWQASIELRQGLEQTYDWFLQQGEQLRGMS